MKPFAIPPLLVMAVAVYVGMEHIGLYLKGRQHRSHLTFGLVTLTAAAYCGFAALRFDAASMTESLAWLRMQFVATALVCPVLLYFVHDILHRKTGWPLRAISACFVGLAAAGLVTDLLIFDSRVVTRHMPLLGVAYFDVVPGLLAQGLIAAVLSVLGYSLVVIFEHYHQRDRSLRPILVSTMLYFLTVVSDVAVNAGLLPLPYLSEFGILFLIVGMDRSLHNDLQSMRRSLEESEEKYRGLVEDSSDIIFVLEPNGVISGMNQSVRTVLGYSVAQLVGTRIVDLLPTPAQTTESLVRLYFQERFLAVASLGEAAEFKTEFLNRRQEPVSLTVKLERVTRGPGMVIHGKASLVPEDVLGRYCLEENVRYRIPNNLSVTEVLIRRISDSIGHFCSAEELSDVRIGLQELLVNAIEHGNLDIKFEEKTAALEAGTYPDLMRERRSNPGLGNRMVEVEYRLMGGEVHFAIEDEGGGFDHRAMLERDILDPAEVRLTHGRGIALARTMFDEVRFNERGNRVELRKRISGAVVERRAPPPSDS